MRLLTYLAIGLLITGAVLVVASSGAFDSTSADRGVGVETAGDEDGLLGLEYLPNRQAELASGQSNGGGGCFFGLCADYRYNDEELVHLEDNTASNDMFVEEITFDESGDDLVGGNGLRHEASDNGFRVLRGDFRCPSNGLFGSGSQQQQNTTITASILVSDGNVTIDLEREVKVECLPDD